MGVILRRCTRFGNVLQILDASSFLDVVREIAAGAVLHDQVYIPLRALIPSLRGGVEEEGEGDTHDDVDEPRNVSMGETLEDLDLALEVLEQFTAQT